MDDFELDKYVFFVRAMDNSSDGNIVSWTAIASGDPEEIMPYLAGIVSDQYVMEYGKPPDRTYISLIPYHSIDDDEDEPEWLEDQVEFLDGPEV